MWRIAAAERDYDWGSPVAIPEFVGATPSGKPVAELWFGTHPLGTATVLDDDRTLTELAGNLPYMLKVLAPAQPLSIQVHPSSTLAELGYAAEESAGVPLTDESRDFKDPHHKPEMVYALTPFETLLGLRPVEEIINLLTPLGLPVAAALLEQAAEGRLAVVRTLLSAPPTPDAVDEFVAACARLLEAGSDLGRGYQSVVEAARIHPSDPGLVLALLLNRVTIEPGEAAFIGPGLIHAHLSGLCLEAMSSSDNVFRGGLTTKRVNPFGVLKSLDVTQPDDHAVRPHRFGDATDVFAPAPGLFALSVTTGNAATLPGSGRRILLCIDGEIDVATESGESLHLRRGEAAFAAAEDGRLSTSGAGTTAQAFVP